MTTRGSMTARLSGACMNPVRLCGFYQRISASSGEALMLVGSSDEPHGVLLVACKDRRASHCVGCATLYERDAYQLIAAGLRGGKSVPASVGTHPAVVLTLTAPSFGAIHGNRDHNRVCRCGRRHPEGDPQIGAALDPDRYRYIEQVIWNHCAPELWKRTVQAIRRGLARALGIPRSQLAHVARVRFAKVAEFQGRGVVHYHAIIRIDGPDRDEAPPVDCTPELLQEVVSAAARAACFNIADSTIPPHRMTTTIRWGAQRQIVVLDQRVCTSAARYIAKYATKSTETVTNGALLRPIRWPAQIGDHDLPDHARRLINAAWRTGELTGLNGLRRWAHQFGYGGHALTKSRDYSITFTALRAARADWHDDARPRGEVIVRAQLKYAGRSGMHPLTSSLPPDCRPPDGQTRGSERG